MKPIALTCFVALWLTPLTVALGAGAEKLLPDHQPPAAAAKPSVAKKATPAKANKATGSYVGPRMNRYGMITDGPAPLYVLDRQAIEQSGAADLGQVLLRRGFRR